MVFSVMPEHAAAKTRKVVGWVEKVKVYPGALEFKAKIDTGALTSSINAKNIIEFERDGETWVRFDVVNRNDMSMTIELPLAREVKIKRHFGKKQKRYVVRLAICLDGLYKKTEVSLVDRQGFVYAMLIGRSFLKKNFIIDPAATFTSSPECQVPEDA